MLYYERIDISEDVNKTSATKSAIFVTIVMFQIRVLSFNQMPVIGIIMF